MTQASRANPKIDRPDAEVAVICSWQTRIGGARVAADALAAAWTAWPEGLLARTCLLGADGQSLVEYAQWRDEAALVAARPAPTMLGGATLEWQTAFRRYRSFAPGTNATPGCIVIVRANFDASDPEGRQRTVDALLGDAASEDEGTAELLGAHFHVSLDAKSILNYAEWTSEAAYKAFVDGPEEPADEADEPMTAQPEPPLDIWTGLTGSSIRRFFLHQYDAAPTG